jgi:hypothetical protein
MVWSVVRPVSVSLGGRSKWEEITSADMLILVLWVETLLISNRFVRLVGLIDAPTLG